MTLAKRVILGIFAHPDDETSAAGGTFTKYAAMGAEVYVITATRGELGTLGTGGMALARDELPAQRERELRQALEMYGAQPPILLGYRDQEVKDADFQQIVARLLGEMHRLAPDVVITFGPRGISDHEDHVTMHRASVEAFHAYRRESAREPSLYYPAIPTDLAEQFEISLDGPEIDPTTIIDTTETRAVKLRALRGYQSQEDAQELAGMFESLPMAVEAFHQAYPPVQEGVVATGFWE